MGFFLLLIATIAGPGVSGYLSGALLLPAPLVALMGVGLFRRRQPGSGFARITQIVTASLLCLVGLVAGVFIVMGLSDSGPGISVPAWVIVTIILAMASLVAALTCGVCGLVSSGSAYSPRLNLTVVISGISTLVLLMASGIVFGFGAAGTGVEGARFILVAVLRFQIITYSLAILLALGLFEIMMGLSPSVETVETSPGPTKEQII